MAHAVSLAYTRFDHMSPTALAMTTLLHAAVAAALYWMSPLNHVDTTPDVIAITMEREAPAADTPPPPVPTPEPAPPPAAAPPAPPPSAPPMRLGLAPVGPSTDPKATPGTEQPAPPKPETPAAEAAQPEPSQPERQAAEPEPAAQHEPPEPQVQQALAAPPPPPPPAPSLEKALPPIEAPPPPVTSQDVPRPAPPPPPPKPPPAQHQPQRAQPAPPAPKPPPQQQALQSSPLSNLPRAPADRQASRQAPTFVNPADMYGQKRAEDEYLWYVARKLSQHQQFVRNASTESGTVVLRLVIARDGRLIDVGLSRSSGVPSLDNVSLSMIRQAAPYPPLPPEIQGAQHTFTLPLYYKRNE